MIHYSDTDPGSAPAGHYVLQDQVQSESIIMTTGSSAEPFVSTDEEFKTVLLTGFYQDVILCKKKVLNEVPGTEHCQLLWHCAFNKHLHVSLQQGASNSFTGHMQPN